MMTRRRLVPLGLGGLLAAAGLMTGAIPEHLAADQGVSLGRALYDQNCRVCHGPQGRGDGYVLFNPPVADLTAPRIQALSDSELAARIHTGRANTAMGSWRLALTNQEIQAVVAYIRTLGMKTEQPPK